MGECSRTVRHTKVRTSVQLVVETFLNFLESAEESITELSQNPWFLVALFFIVMFDSVFPILPSEFSVIAGGVTAGSGTLMGDQRLISLVAVIVVGALGAFAGDSLGYVIGNRSERLLTSVFFRGEKGAKRLESTSRQIRKRGGLLLVTARFIPGGRTAMTFSCGLTQQPFLSWFTKWDLLASTLWSSYAALLGFFVAGSVDDPGTAIWWAFGVAVGITVLIEVGRWVLERVRASKGEAVSELTSSQ